MKNRVREKVFVGLIIPFLLILPTILYAQKQLIEVVVENAKIREKPDTKSDVIETPSVGNVFEAIKKVGKWYEIKMISKLGIPISGYIHKRYVKVIKEPIKEKKAVGFLIEAVGIYFQPSDQSFKDIYGGGTFYGGEMGIFWKGIGIWAGGHYFTKEGITTFTKEKTEMQITPIYGGIKFRVPNARISPYLGLGVGYFKYKETTPFGSVEKGDIGYIGQIGFIFKIIGPLCLDIKGSYSYCKVKPEDIEANLGGLQGVIGVGFDF